MLTRYPVPSWRLGLTRRGESKRLGSHAKSQSALIHRIYQTWAAHETYASQKKEASKCDSLSLPSLSCTIVPGLVVELTQGQWKAFKKLRFRNELLFADIANRAFYKLHELGRRMRLGIILMP